MNKKHSHSSKKQDEKSKNKEYLDKGEIPGFGKKWFELKLHLLAIIILGTFFAVIIYLFW